MSGPADHSPGDDHPPAEPSDPVGPGGTDPDEPARHDRGQGGTARPSASARRRRSLPGRSRVRITMPTQADLDRLPAEVRMELRNQQRAQRHQWLNSLGILFGVLFAAGSLVASGLALRTAQEDVRIARESQLTDRYAKTLEPLTSGNITIRLAAIHAFNRLLADSQRDRAAITAVLAGFIRDRAPAPTTKDKDLPSEPSVDITAALTTLANNPHPVPPLDLHGIRTPYMRLGNAHFNNASLGGADLRGSDLSKADLRAAHLYVADLAYADLRNANLTGASLVDADLSGAYMRGAHLSGADLRGARLREHRRPRSVSYLRAGDTPANVHFSADLRGADLRGANLYEADLQGAYLYEADLRGVNLDMADLRGADLRGARFSVGLDEVRRLAKTDTTTRW